MAREKIGNFEYDSVSAETLLGKLEEISEIEMRGYMRGLENGFHAPAYLYTNGSLGIIGERDTIGLEPSSDFHFDWGNMIYVRRKKVSLAKRAVQRVGLSDLEPSQKIEGLVEFLEQKIGLLPSHKFTEIAYAEGRSERVYDLWMGDSRRGPHLIYLEKIGDFSRETKININTGDYTPEDFKEKSGLQQRHIVEVTRIRVKS